MLIIIKVLIILFLLCLWEQGTAWQFSKQISKLLFQMNVQVYFFIGHTEGQTKAFFRRLKEGAPHREIASRSPSLLYVSPFVKLEIIPPLRCCLLDPVTNKYSRAWSSEICGQIPGPIKRILLFHLGKCLIITQSFQEKMFPEIWCCHINHNMLESSSWFDSTKLLSSFFISSHHVLKIYM